MVFQRTSSLRARINSQRRIGRSYRILRRKYGFVSGTVFTPKRNNRTQGYVQGCPFTKLKQLNPTSRDHIAWILKTHENWTPSQLTATGKPVVDETVLKDIGSETALLFLKCLDITKKLGMISEGVNAWQKLSTTSNRIHHHCSVATNTFRCAHRKPNSHKYQVTKDLENYFKLHLLKYWSLPILVALSSGCSPTTSPDTIKDATLKSLQQEIYTKQTQIELESTRRQVKTVTYAFLYGAGNIKLGGVLISYYPKNPLHKREPIYVKLMLLPYRVSLSCYRLVRYVVREIMQTPSTVVVSALTKGISFSTTSYRKRSDDRQKMDGHCKRVPTIMTVINYHSYMTS